MDIRSTPSTHLRHSLQLVFVLAACGASGYGGMLLDDHLNQRELKETRLKLVNTGVELKRPADADFKAAGAMCAAASERATPDLPSMPLAEMDACTDGLAKSGKYTPKILVISVAGAMRSMRAP